MRFLIYIAIFVLVAHSTQAREPGISRGQAYEVLQPALATSTGVPSAKPQGLRGRVVTGYQGWFRVEGDKLMYYKSREDLEHLG